MLVLSHSIVARFYFRSLNDTILPPRQSRWQLATSRFSKATCDLIEKNANNRVADFRAILSKTFDDDFKRVARAFQPIFAMLYHQRRIISQLRKVFLLFKQFFFFLVHVNRRQSPADMPGVVDHLSLAPIRTSSLESV